MPAGIRCPQCGGGDLRQVTPGYYECLEQIVVGAAPPEATGLPHPTPVERPCATRFQIGGAGTTSPCAFCGLDSIGTCEGGCARRLCGNHGTIRPPFLCGECLGRKQAERARAEAAVREQAEDERARDLARVESVLATSEDPGEVARILREREKLVDVDRCRAAWTRLVTALPLTPTHELVSVVGRGIRYFDLRVGASEPGRWHEVEGSRVELWCAAGVGSIRQRSYGDIPGSVDTGIRIFLSAAGEYWRSTGCEETLFLEPGGRGRRQFVLPRGRQFQPVRRRGHMEIPESVQVSSPSAPTPYFDRSIEDPYNLVRAVAAILAGPDESPSPA